jgi:hypothetical protein
MFEDEKRNGESRENIYTTLDASVLSCEDMTSCRKIPRISYFDQGCLVYLHASFTVICFSGPQDPQISSSGCRHKSQFIEA